MKSGETDLAEVTAAAYKADIEYLQQQNRELEAKVAQMTDLFQQLKAHGQFFWSAIEFEHDFDGEAFEKDVDQALAELPRKTLAHIQADAVEHFYMGWKYEGSMSIDEYYEEYTQPLRDKAEQEQP